MIREIFFIQFTFLDPVVKPKIEHISEFCMKFSLPSNNIDLKDNWTTVMTQLWLRIQST